MADWGSLQDDIVRLIADKLPVIDDFVALTAVCRSYRSATDKDQWRPDMSCRPPWLLLCCQGGDEKPPTGERGFLNMYKGKEKKMVMNLPELDGRRCWGSPYGWIVTLGLDQQLHLFNPLSRRRIQLPQITCERDWIWNEDEKSHWMRKYYINRAILIKRPPSSYSSSVFNDFLVVTTGRELCEFNVLRPHSWEPVKFYFLGRSKSPGYVYDVALYNGKIYMLGIRGRLFICSNFDGPDPPVAEEFVSMDTTLLEGNEKLYLVEYNGELLMVVRIYDNYEDREPYYNTAGFEAYKFNFETNKWIEVVDLGDYAIFVGDCQSISIPQPETVGYQKNCIYFTDDNYAQFGENGVGGHDMGIYDFDKMTIQSLYDGADSLSTYSTPTWLLPSFN